jgi:hypothetical protein
MGVCITLLVLMGFLALLKEDCPEEFAKEFHNPTSIITGLVLVISSWAGLMVVISSIILHNKYK